MPKYNVDVHYSGSNLKHIDLSRRKDITDIKDLDTLLYVDDDLKVGMRNHLQKMMAPQDYDSEIVTVSYDEQTLVVKLEIVTSIPQDQLENDVIAAAKSFDCTSSALQLIEQ